MYTQNRNEVLWISNNMFNQQNLHKSQEFYTNLKNILSIRQSSVINSNWA